MKTPNLDPRVDKFIKVLPHWQKKICKEVRNLVHQADSEVEETIKRSDRPYFILKGNICALQSTKDHVNIFIYDPIAPDPENIINQGNENKTARTIQIFEDDSINKTALLQLFKAVIANNKKGGWRKLNS
jgi:hypothetical protein